ncbi:NlpC/P60 family protein [Pectinatus brassicae]|nr:NlpC/P60 family protein [Pectinatus brassicae]
MKKKLSITIVMICFLAAAFTQIAMANGITNYPPLCSAQFWQDKMSDGKNIVLNDTEKTAFNTSIIKKTSSMADLKNYPLTMSRADIKNMAQASAVFPNNSYDENGQLLSANEKNELLEKMNLANLPQTQNLLMGIVVKHSNIRTMPTLSPVFSVPYASQFDMFQETVADANEPVIILNTSTDNNFYYIQMYNYRGWIASANVAIVQDRNKWLNYVQPENFLVVTGKSYTLPNSGENIFYQMGSKIVFTQKKGNIYRVIVPQRDDYGYLQENNIDITLDDNLHEGFLPYTRNNIIAEAFKYYGEPYGWGGLKNSVDCSSFIANIYRTVGIYLPRNADEQEQTYGRHYDFSGLNEAQIYQNILDNCKPGDALYMDGHTMLYLGNINGTPYIIHALGSYTRVSDGSYSKQRILRVVVSDLSLHLSSGNSFAAALTSAVSFH